jgi:hypothetical protein
LLDVWRRALVVGHLTVRDSMKGTLEGRAALLGNAKDEVFERLAIFL